MSHATAPRRDPGAPLRGPAACEVRRAVRRILIDYALGLPGVVPTREAPGTPLDLALGALDRLGPAEAFLDGNAFGRFRPQTDGGLELVLPAQAWAGAVRSGRARPLASDATAGSARVALVQLPDNPVEVRATMELIETAWAYARGL